MIITFDVAATFTYLLRVSIVLFCSNAYTSESTLLVFGDSISAAYGMEENQGWVHLLAQQPDIKTAGFEVVNASVSGETTDGGLIRLPKTLALHQPNIVVIELGGNDGLRGYPIDNIRTNIDEMIRLSRASGARVLLIGMVLPPNYGRRYTSAFESVFSAAAAKFDINVVPFLLNGVATDESLMQRDGIHPRPEAQQLMLDGIWPYLQPMVTPL
ncbi:MAG: acyl-CoA thioesterase-1 [Candidatus Pseudothioglobus sp.]